MWSFQDLEVDDDDMSPPQNNDGDEEETQSSYATSEVLSPQHSNIEPEEMEEETQSSYATSEVLSSQHSNIETEEMEETQSSYAVSEVLSPQHFNIEPEEMEPDSDSDDEERTGEPPSNNEQVDMLILKSLKSYRTQCFEPVGYLPLRTTHANVMCEVLHVRTSEELRTARILRPPISRVLWPAPTNNDWFNSPSTFAHTEDYQRSAAIAAANDGTSSEGTVTSPSPHSSVSHSPCTPPLGPPTPDTSFPRRRRCSTGGMPQPSVLAKQVANRVIRFARSARNVHEEDLCCLNCGLFPVCPVTGKCGHTRCTKCINQSSRCPCGYDSPEPLFVNILIRDLIGKSTTQSAIARCAKLRTPKTSLSDNKLLVEARSSPSGPLRLKRRNRTDNIATYLEPDTQHVPMSARARLNYALELLQTSRHSEAAPHLALAAASSHSDLRVARHLLAQVITVLSRNRDPRILTRELTHVVRLLSRATPVWMTRRDMECILCCEVLAKPVTTPCGHMFCRTCLEKTLDYRKRCPLCLRGLGDFKLTETRDTVFLKSALACINGVSVPLPLADAEDELIVPIFVCTVAYPSVPCPLFIFDPRYWRMIRRVLKSGSRRFGMVAMDREKKYADYGTILEVRDCVQLEDGRSILSTIGLSRFKVIERSTRDGYEVARVQPILDIPPDDEDETDSLKIQASQIMYKAVLWLTQLSKEVISDIENAFGALRSHETEDTDEWWESCDGPAWLWWLIAVLPLRTEIKVLILSTSCLMKRMMAVVRTLEAVQHVTLTTMAPGQCEVRVTMPQPEGVTN